MHAIDTNVLVRLLVRDDPRQLDAAEKFIVKGAWVSHMVLVETLWVLDAVYERSAAQIVAAVERLLAHAELTLQDADVVAAALGQFRSKPTLGFSDCLVLEVARKSGHLPLGTFDRQLGKVAGAQLINVARQQPGLSRTGS
jgi:predicted nucleic-acid-binding protein